MTPYTRKLVFRIIPLSFGLGAAVEWFMLRVQIGRETFYDTYVRLESERLAQERAAALQSGNPGGN
eukprot:m.145061 g.145061  ORF g.145061 m.145061 type:complete len:66 (+) comp11613_c0_seq2:1574-1771(+)